MLDLIFYLIFMFSIFFGALVLLQIIENIFNFIFSKPKRKVRVQKRVIRNQRENRFYNYVIE